MTDNKILEEWCNDNQWPLEYKDEAAKTLNYQMFQAGYIIRRELENAINGFICETIGIYRTLRCMQFTSGHDFIGNNAYGELKCKRCGYVSKGDPRFDSENNN